MTKLTIAFFLLSLLIAFVLTKRCHLRSGRVWVGAVISLVISSPHIIWYYENHCPQWISSFTTVASTGVAHSHFWLSDNDRWDPWDSSLRSLGWVFYFRSKFGRPYLVLGLAFLILLVVFTLTNAKPYFFMGAYPFAFAGGAFLIDRISKNKEMGKAILSSYLFGVHLIGVVLAPLYAPVLASQTFAQYYGGLTGAAKGAGGQQTAGVFPQYLGDRFGWIRWHPKTLLSTTV